ncbi:MAG: AAA family ATPase [Planctomycetes bacterium]|nr:AAA family ATPase [Planctomycetota bacterium]NUQ34319.1 AAA family ATPase [Planctomycetaceae bacterium]
MAENDIEALRQALECSPDNMPLCKHLAELYLRSGKANDAETLLRSSIERAGNDSGLKHLLARCFYQQGKDASAAALIEQLLRAKPEPEIHLLHARVLLREGHIERAREAYLQSIEVNPSLADEDLAERLDVKAHAKTPKERKATTPETNDEDWDVKDGKVRVATTNDTDPVDAEVERPSLNFASVGGMEHVKEQIRLKIILPLQKPELFKAYGKTIGGGILMYGPPGCGKTHLARATAGEVKAKFISVGINDVLNMWIGESEKNLHHLFEQARDNAPCVIFFDEVDALGASRRDMRQSAGRQLINQFLSELDGLGGANDGVLVLAATNAPWHLDTAFRRPGRFDRVIFVPPPDDEARAEILRIHCSGKPQDAIDFEHVAKKAKDFSGADLMAVVDRAVEMKLTAALKTGVPAPLTTKDLLGGVKEQKPTTKEWFSTAKNYALYSNQGGIYDDILDFMKLR